jgi:tetratricopeptide (TPR) repeat protein
LELAQKCLDLAREDLGDDNPQLAFMYNLLAEIHTCLNELGEAENDIQESIRLQERLPKARLKYAETLQKKAMIYYDHNSNEAKEYLVQALDAARNTVNEGHPFINSLNDELENLQEDKNKQLVSL